MMFQEAEPIILQEFTQPEVINQDLLISLVINQGPKEDAAKYFHRDGIKLDEVKEIRIEFLNILHISHLWVMKNLVKLNLSNNLIEKIENLDDLIHLKELDLSFNYIELMENLSHLINLEVLLLHCNKITIVNGLDNLQKLEIFSIGNNKINDWNHVLYLRKLKRLRSLNTDENSCTEQNGYTEYVIAFIPQLVYFRYNMITEDERQLAINKHHDAISNLEEVENKEKAELETKKIFQDHIKLLTISYVEYLDEDYLFTEMFKNDKEGNLFLAINDDTQEAYENYKKSFCDICHELYKRGLQEHDKRTEEIKLFKNVVERGTENIENEAKTIMNKIINRKKVLFKELSQLLKIILKEDELTILEEKVKRVQSISGEFNELMSNAWNDLMHKEIVFHQQIEDINETFIINMTDMVDTFLEAVQSYFGQMRNIETEYNKTINEIIIKYMSTFEGNSNIPMNLIDLCGDKDILNNNLAATHDVHLQVIDAREDRLVNRLKKWLEDFTEQLVKDEHKRHRCHVLEISHFLEFQHEEFTTLQLQNHYDLEDVENFKIAAFFDKE